MGGLWQNILASPFVGKEEKRYTERSSHYHIRPPFAVQTTADCEGVVVFVIETVVVLVLVLTIVVAMV